MQLPDMVLYGKFIYDLRENTFFMDKERIFSVIVE